MRKLLAGCFGALLVCAGSQAHAAWYEARSKHFIIYADDKEDRLRTFAQRLERFDQAVRLVRGTDDPELTDSNRLRIYVLGSEGAVAKLIGFGGARGMYQSRVSGSVAFVPRTAGSSNFWDLDTEHIFFHEYAHHLQLQNSMIAMPPWVREGFAEFFATAKIGKDDSITIGNYPPYRVAAINAAPLSVPQVVAGSFSRPNAWQVDAIYGFGWLLMHYLTFDESRKGQLTKYIDGIQAGLSQSDAATAAFGDLKQLDHDVHRYMRHKLTGIVIKPQAISIAPIALRPLSPAEAAIMPVVIRSRRGVDKAMASKVVVDARKAAAPYPNDPFVQAALAEAEYDSGDYAAANAAADRALAVDSKNVHALIYKGRAQLGLAKANPGAADWGKIRRWFIKANSLDTENGEPLALFYRSFEDAGQKPTQNAVDALLYAAALAPQDDGVRLLAVRELVRQNKLKEAKVMFTSIAYQPHRVAAAQDTSQKIMDAISAGNGKLALSLIEGSEKEGQSPAQGH